MQLTKLLVPVFLFTGWY